MKRTHFEFLVITHGVFTRAEYDRLLVLSTTHYDARCRQAGKPGGFLYGWGVESTASINELPEQAETTFGCVKVSQVIHPGGSYVGASLPDVNFRATTGQLDLLCKIVEADTDEAHRSNSVRVQTGLQEHFRQAVLAYTTVNRWAASNGPM